VEQRYNKLIIMMDDQSMGCNSGDKSSRLGRDGLWLGVGDLEGKGFHDEGRIFRERNLARGFMIWAKVRRGVSYDAYIFNVIFIRRGHSEGMCIA